ncbi:MAG: radical SAM family heme chaperone HemW, partial [Victivallaceae bacterium]
MASWFMSLASSNNIYIHVPFCRSKCAYCVFYSEPNVQPEAIELYLNKLEADLAAAELSSPVSTLFFGGGTPSLLDERQLEKLFALCRRYLPLSNQCEISIESNPETLTRDKIKLIENFVTRISLGIQSFDPVKRKILGRAVSDTAIYKAVELIKNSQIPHFNMDLIYGVRGENALLWRRELQCACQFTPDHLSAYALTIEEGSKLATLPESADSGDDAAAELWLECGEFLAKNQLPRYEVSNYAAPSGRCRHNSNVWHGMKYLGFGPAASSFDGNNRWTQVADLRSWLSGAGAEMDVIPVAERAGEVFAMGLRTNDGWSVEQWEKSDFYLQNRISWDNLLKRCRKYEYFA